LISETKKQETFIFTPRPGNIKLNAANREIYERAMALVSCVRKGQLLHDKYRIRLPVRILESLKEKVILIKIQKLHPSIGIWCF
jgi:hypothetical protein